MANFEREQHGHVQSWVEPIQCEFISITSSWWYLDCIAKCGAAFESTMKVLCDKRRIAHKQTDTASTLLKALMVKGELDSFWEQPLILIATVRNRLSSAHGAGTLAKVVPQHVATYAVNATASAILLLVGEFQ